NRTVGVIRSGVPAVVGEINLDALDLFHFGNTAERVFEALDAVTPAEPAGVVGLMRHAVVVDGEFRRHHAGRVTRGLGELQRGVAQGQRGAVHHDAVALGRARRRRTIAAGPGGCGFDQLPVLFGRPNGCTGQFTHAVDAAPMIDVTMADEDVFDVLRIEPGLFDAVD